MQMQPSSLISLSPSSPSFNSYSSGKLAEIAARVVQEFSNDDNDSLCNLTWQTEDRFDPIKQNMKEAPIEEDEGDDDDDDDEEFEFVVVRGEPEALPISADEIFYNGQIRPVYPLFNTDLLLDNDELSQLSKSVSPVPHNRTAKPVRLPLGKLFSEDRETTSCSSSEADDLENVPADSYCVWTPKKPAKDEAISAGRCKKSSSTGSSKRWKFRDLLYRSNSDGKESYVFLSPAAKKCVEEKEKQQEGVVEKHYIKSRALKGGDKRRSFLPYRPDLVRLLLP